MNYRNCLLFNQKNCCRFNVLKNIHFIFW